MTEPLGPPTASARAAERLQLLIDSVRDYAIFLLDAEGRIQTWNLGAQLIKGYSEGEILGESHEVFYAPEDRAAGKPARLLERARREGRVEDEGWRVRKDGSRFWSDVVITALYDGDELIGYAKVTRDLTERRQAEELRLQLARAQEALRLRDEFMSIAAHELRSPLVALQLQIESLAASNGNLLPAQQVKVNRAVRNLHRMSSLITTLLDVARIARGELKLDRKQLELAPIVAEAIDRLSEVAETAHCEVVADLEAGIAGRWDPLRMGQVVSNLLTNAFKYAPRTRVDVTLRRDDDIATLRVSDRGPGIPPGTHERVFERFERAGTTRSSGMGLGLYVAREIVSAHGGTIRAVDREGGGTEVELRLPIRDTRDMLPEKDAP